jgi:hypothetical protein
LNIAVSVGDIGGQRALFPLLEKIINDGNKVFIFSHRLEKNEVNNLKLEIVDVDLANVDSFIKEHKIEKYIFSTSVADRFALEMAEIFKSKYFIPSICVLDNWMNYKVRMELGNNQYHFPTIYCVMDELAKSEAILAGIPEECLRITGLHGIIKIDQIVSEQKFKISSDKKIILFINEPASIDQGVDSSNPKFRGYTEYQVMDDLFVENSDFFKNYKILVCPHPRDNMERLELYLNKLKNNLDISFAPEGNSLRLIHLSSGVIGMASIFLFYSWLYQVPTLSYQPNLRLSDLKLLSKRKGVIFLTEKDTLKLNLGKFEKEVGRFEFNIDNKRKIFHEYITPPYNILEILGSL